MPALRIHEDVWRIDGEEGYVFGRGRKAVKKAVMRFGDWQQSLKFAFIPKNKARGLKLLQEEQARRKNARLIELEYQELRRTAERHGIVLPDDARMKEPLTRLFRETAPQEPAVKGEQISLKNDAVEAFEKATYAHVSPDVKRHHRRSIQFYIERGKDVRWNPKVKEQREDAYEVIHDMLVDRHNTLSIMPSTIVKYRNYLIPIFDYFITRGWLDRNPASGLKCPKVPRRSVLGRWTEQELGKILPKLKELDTEEDPFSLSVTVLLKTGMRPNELLTVTRSQAASDYIPVSSKTKRGEKPNVRWIPVNLLPGLREALDALLALPPMRGEYLVPWEKLPLLRDKFTKAVKAAKIDPERRALACCRKSAIWWLEHDLLWARQDIIDMVGHTEEVDELHYREAPDGKALEDRITRRRLLLKPEVAR